MYSLVYNYSALALAILNLNYTVDSAIDYFSPQQQKKNKIPHEIAENMVLMRSQGKTYKDIGKLYGLKADAVYNRIRRYKGVI
ncbi:MAG: helix-turn-helix domain-containing protein [Veillonellales bacterium]